MANLGSITLNEIEIFEIDSDPSIDGLEAPTGSLAILTDGSKMFLKNGEGDAEWTAVSPDSSIVKYTEQDTEINSEAFTTINDLSIVNLSPGLYKFDLLCEVDSSGGAENIGLKLNSANSLMSIKYGNGTITNTIDDKFIISSYGIFEVTESETINIQLKTINNTNIVNLKSNSTFIVNLL